MQRIFPHRIESSLIVLLRGEVRLLEAWAVHELGSADYGDVRLNQRGCLVLAAFAKDPDGSIPHALNSWTASKAAYRFLDNHRVDPEETLAAHSRATAGRCSDLHTILVAQDTTFFNFTTHRKTNGLGPINGPAQRGIIVHSALAMTTDGVPLGVVHQQVFVRKEVGDRTTPAKSRNTSNQKESRRWTETMRAAARKLDHGNKRVVVIGDRESDIFDVFVSAHQEQFSLLIRASWDRQLKDHPEQVLFAAVAAADPLGTVAIEVPRSDQQPSRTATVTLRATRVTLLPPQNRRGEELPHPTIYVVEAKEEQPPDGVKPIHWVLCTTIGVSTLAEAARMLEWYTYRWRIERLHYILKTGGCQVEKLQLQEEVRLHRAISLYTIVAWRLLWMTYAARQDPDQPCTNVFSADEAEALAIVRKEQSPKKPAQMAPGGVLTLREAVRTMAQMGGFLGRKGDGEPGAKVLWRGYRKLEIYALAVRAVKRDLQQ